MNREILVKLIDLARWAPSGDNTQPWRFEIISDNHIVVHGHDTREQVLYDFDGHASHIAHGALLETLRIGATRFGLTASWSIRPGSSDDAPKYDIALTESDVREDPLAPYIKTRTVQRRPMRMSPLTPAVMTNLSAEVGEDFSLQFLNTLEERIAVARLLWKSAYIRLTCPEAFEVHRSIIEWKSRFSATKIPDQAVGTEPITTIIMKWGMQSWRRVDFLNRYFGGTIIPRIQLDAIPAVACATHVLLRPNKPQTDLASYLSAGAAIQRLWLGATKEGLYLQPQMTPLIFRWYSQSNRRFSASDTIAENTRDVSRLFEKITRTNADDPYSFFCRIGYSAEPYSRSLRMDVQDLLIE